MHVVRGIPANPPDVSDGLPVAVLVVDGSLHAVHANPAWLRLFGLGDDARADSWLLRFDDVARGRVKAYLGPGTDHGGEPLEVVHGEDGDRWAELRVAPLAGSEDGRMAIVAVDVSAAKRREAELAFDATHDALTGLENRAAVLSKTQWALARLARRPSFVAVLFIDLENFKAVNDRFGHRMGDELLTLVARRLAAAVRPSDVVGRVGGDEFVVVCEALGSAAEADVLADRVATAIRGPLQISGSAVVTLGATIGVAVTDSPATTAVALIERADRAMYQGKRGFRAPVSDAGSRDGLVVAGEHLASVERDLRLEWNHSLQARDPDVTRRWFVASELVRRAVVALGSDGAGVIA